MIKQLMLDVLQTSIIMSVLVLAIGFLSPLFNKRYIAKMKYWVWLVIALRLLVPFQLSFMPVSAPVNIPVVDYTVVEMPQPQIQPDTTTPYLDETPIVDPDPNPILNDPIPDNVLEQQPDVHTQQPDTTTSRADQSDAEPAAHIISAIDIAIRVWLAGLTGYLVWQCITMLRFRALLKKAEKLPVDSPVLEALQKIKTDMGIKRHIDIFIWEQAPSPFLTGLFRRKLVLPSSRYNDSELDLIIRHELTHSKRRDLWYKAFLNAANALHWFNPVIYYMKKCASKDLELICDETVTAGKDIDLRMSYGELILQNVEHGRAKYPTLSTNMSTSKKTIKTRIQNIMNTKIKKKGISVVLCILLCIALAGSLIACSTTSAIDKAMLAVIDKDAEAACESLGYSGNAALYKEALAAIEDCGITILSCQVDRKSVNKTSEHTYGEATLQIEVADAMYWAGDKSNNWLAVTVPGSDFAVRESYDVRFEFYITEDKVSFGDVVSVYQTSDPENIINTPAYVNHMIELLNGCNPDSTFAQKDLIITLDMPTSIVAFVNRIEKGFDEVAAGNYDEACDTFGFPDAKSKDSFKYGMQFVDKSSLTILYATVDEASINQSSDITTAIVTLYVQQDSGGIAPKNLENMTDQELSEYAQRVAQESTFGYIGEWPIGVYSMSFVVEMKDGAISIPEFTKENSNDIPGLTAVYFPGETQSSLKYYDEGYDNIGNRWFVYDSGAPFMTQLWTILQSYDLTSMYAILWGFG